MNEHNQARSGDESDPTAEDERAVKGREPPSAGEPKPIRPRGAHLVGRGWSPWGTNLVT
jgi:hypothetical protein